MALGWTSSSTGPKSAVSGASAKNVRLARATVQTSRRSAKTQATSNDEALYSGLSPEERSELERLRVENRRLRTVVEHFSDKLSPSQRSKFAAQYGQLAQSAAGLGLQLGQGLMQQLAIPIPHERPSVVSPPQAPPAPSAPGFAERSLDAEFAPLEVEHMEVMQSDVKAAAAGAIRGGRAFGPASSVASLSGGRALLMGRQAGCGIIPHAAQVRVGGPKGAGAGRGRGRGRGKDSEPPPVPSPPSSGPSPTQKQEAAASAMEFKEVGSTREFLKNVANLSVELDVSDSEEEGSGRKAQAAAPAVSPERLAARALVEGHVPAEAVADKQHWLVVTVPEKPVAGEDLVVYFNKNQSDPLRHCPKLRLIYGFNKWELQPEDSGDTRLDLAPAPIPRDQGSDFWSCRLKVPENTFEVNMVFTDGEHVFDNNGGADFTYPVAGGITWDHWVDTAAERARAKEAKRLAAEKAAAEEAERQRQAALAEQDKEKGWRRAHDLKNSYGHYHANATTKAMAGDRVMWRTVPETIVPGTKLQLLYNQKAGPLAPLVIPPDQALTLRYGFNQWQQPTSVTMTRAPELNQAGEEWYAAEIEVPSWAANITFVTNMWEHWDNNGGQDHKVKVDLPVGLTLDMWVASCAELFRHQEFEARMAYEQAERAKAARRAEKRRQAQEFVKAVERRKVRHVLFTEPEVVEAGQELTIYYNPQNTNLAGRQKVYVRGGFNRWTHPRSFGPLEMTPPQEGFHWKATIKVPGDAYKVDFVFSDVAEGSGTYDNRFGYDYHLPVEGSPVRDTPLHICHVSVEMAPISKVGGLGDVVTALGRAVQEQGHLVEVILPKYDFFNSSPILHNNMRFETEFDWGGTKIYVSSGIVEGLRCFFVEPKNGFFNTGTVYGRNDDEMRFDFFCKAALEFLLRTGRQPDILHCHDWSTAHVARTYWHDYHPYGLGKPKVVFTIHNLQYGQKKIAEAAYYSQRFTTVSPTYAFEIGGHPTIAPHGAKFCGIRNGIDMELWDPENNTWLAMPYGPENVVAGKREARRLLRQRVGLSDWGDKFIVGVVSRLTSQKGMHLIKHAAFRALERGGQFVLLGSAPDPKVQGDFNAMASGMQGANAAFCFKYDEPLSHMIYAACDMIVVPSMFEPCGLTQMIAMRYGAVPIVRHTGGLRDTVFDVDFDKERAAWDVYGSTDWKADGIDATNGFAFSGTDPGALDYALNRAIDAWYNDKTWFHSLQRRVMEQDWSWNRPAIDYIELYYSAIKA